VTGFDLSILTEQAAAAMETDDGRKRPRAFGAHEIGSYWRFPSLGRRIRNSLNLLSKAASEPGEQE
jgi:hypothetical protein